MTNGAKAVKNGAENAVNGGEKGNTDPSRPNGKVRYMLTWHIGELKVDELIRKTLEFCEFNCKRYIFQLEICPQTGGHHIQGYVVLKIRRRFTELKKLLQGSHWEPCMGNDEKCMKYCCKEESADLNYGFYQKGFDNARRWKCAQLDIIKTLFQWQSDVLRLLSNKNYNIKRHVIWIYDYTGNVGKTAFAKYLCYKYNAIYVCNGKSADIRNIIFNNDMMVEDRMIVANYAKCTEHINYQVIEDIKDGIICNTKYETGMKLFNSPHFIAFSNQMPDVSKMSEDRWLIFEIIDFKLVAKNTF